MPTYRSMQPPNVILSQKGMYVTYDSIYNLDTTSGKIQQNSLIQGSLSINVADDIIFVSNQGRNIVQALNTPNNKQLWNYTVEGELCYSPPTVVNGVVYLTTNQGNVYALRATSGTLLWYYKTSPQLFVSPTIYESVAYVASIASSSSQVVVPNTSMSQTSLHPLIYALQTRTGALLWQTKLSIATTFPLTISDSRIYVSASNVCMAFKSSDGSLLWQSKMEGTCRSEPIVVDGKVIISLSVFKSARSTSSSKKIRQWQDTFLCALQANDGTLCWKQPLRTGSGESDSATSNDPYKSASEPGSPLGGDPTVPFITDNVIYVGVGGTLHAFHLSTGTHLWDYHTEGTFLSSPKASGGRVYIGANNGSVYALQANDGTFLWQTYLR